MIPFRRRKSSSVVNYQTPKKANKEESEEEEKKSEWSCVDSCCWFIGWMCATWWVLMLLYRAVPASYVKEAIAGPVPDSPGAKLRNEGLTVKHPVVFVPGLVTAGLELWEGKPCADDLFRKRLWGGTFGHVYKKPSCWAEHMSLDNETGLDPPGIRVRPVSGLVAADYFAAGYFVWAVLIANLAQIGYEEKNMYMAAYDWRLSFQNTEVRDRMLSRIKSNVELMVATNGGNKAVIIPHSMGVLYFLHFMKWVEAPAPMGGGGGPDWCAKHIKAVMNIGGPFLGVPKALAGLFSAEGRDIAVARAIAPDFLDTDILGHFTLQYVMKIIRTWDSVMSLLPRGGDTIWGDLDQSPDEDYAPNKQKINCENVFFPAKCGNYGRLISFGKYVAEAPTSQINRINFKDVVKRKNDTSNTCRDVWTEYDEMASEDVKAVADYRVYTAGEIVDLLRFVAPKMMARGGDHFSYGIADDLDDPKYQHYRYWSNPLETKLPNAPEMEIFSLYGIGIPTERAYIYKQTPPRECHIPFQIDTSHSDVTDGNNCLKNGVYTVDGDETMPVLSAGYMCAKGWRGKTRFNPSGIRTYIREYEHDPPESILECRGTQSGNHVDIMGNFALIEDVMRVAAGSKGKDLGGDSVYSDIFKWSEKIKLRL